MKARREMITNHKEKLKISFAKILRKSAVILLVGSFIVLSGYQKSLNKSDFKDHFLKATQLKIKETNDNISRTEKNTISAETKLAQNFYFEHNYRPVWTFETELNDNANILIELFNHLNRYGLYTKDYKIKELKKMAGKLEKAKDKKEIAEKRADLDLLLTKSCFTFLMQLHNGLEKHSNEELNDSLAQYYIETLTLALRDNFKERILAVQPNFIEYRKLQRALENFVDNTRINDFRAEIKNENLKSTHSAVLLVLKNYNLISNDDLQSDSAVTAALKRYQRLLGIKASGKLDKKTIKHLNTSTNEIFNLVAENLDKYRKNKYSENCVFVNIPEYKLKVVSNNSLVGEYNVVVGKLRNRTPEIQSKIETIVVNPYWIVPKKIAIYEILPRIIKDSTFLARNRYEVIDRHRNVIDQSTINWNEVTYENFEYVLRQKSFYANALGKIKFLFPNNHSVYVHDTPSKKYFTKERRAYSHGCIRLENPFDFADNLLHLVNQSSDSTKQFLESKKREEISIQQPADIYIQYFTCSADDSLNLLLHDDIYNLALKN
jgi:murein L,D-transpeptidase YcbB/YkuD